jgi:ketosteroid isomerase-like protein
MPEEKIAGIMREFVKAMAAGEVDKTLAYFTDDAVSTNPYGTFKGKEAIKRNLTAMSTNMKDMKVTETGNGIITQGDKAFFEHVLSGTYQGKKFEMLALCAYEFSGDKIKNVRSVYDRLLTAKQVVTGWPAKPIVNMVVKQMEKAMK